jgi:Zn-dependent protease
MAGTFRIARIFGFDVNVHWSWALIFVLLTYTYGTDLLQDLYPQWTESRRLVVGAAVALVFFLSILLHEMSHSIVARRYGIPVGSITLFIFGGVSNLTKEPENSKQEFWIAIVGPLTSFVLGGVFGLLYLGLHRVEGGLAEVGLHLALINVVLAIFNLVPGFPLDGGRVLRSVFWARKRNILDATKLASKVGQYVAYGMMGLGAVAAIPFGSVFVGIWLFVIGNFLRSSSAASYEELFVETVLRGVPASAVASEQYVPVSPEVSLSELVEDHVLAGPARAFPVMAGQELLGLVTLSDLRAIPRELWPTTTVFRAMTPFSKLRTVSPQDDLPVVLQELAAGDVNQIPMVDGHLLLGLIHRGDVIRYIQTRQALGGSPIPVRREHHPSA